VSKLIPCVCVAIAYYLVHVCINSRSPAPSLPKDTLKRKERSDSIRSMGLARTRYSAYLCDYTTCRGRGTVTYQSESAQQTSHWTGLCRMVHTYFAEFPFYALGLSAALLEELYTFTGEGWEQEDDITLLTLKCSPTRS
jgi:hypothetical protein